MTRSFQILIVLFVVLFSVPIQAQDVQTSLTHYWALDDTVDVRWDAIGNAHMVPWGGEPEVVETAHGVGLRTTMKDQLLYVPSKFVRPDSGSFSVAVNVRFPSTNDGVIRYYTADIAP